jgi:hypothetical protein
MRETLAAAGIAVLAAVPGWTASLLDKEDLKLDFGGRFEKVAELEDVTDEPVRDLTRIYLFDTQDRLYARGEAKGIRFSFENAFGGESYSTSNGSISLLEFYADVPVKPWPGLSVVVGQYKLPTNLESSQDEGLMLFTEKSDLNQLFFNTGYDSGLGVRFQGKTFDAFFGTSTAAPDIPQRYLPELFKVPPLLEARLGCGNIQEDYFHKGQYASGEVDEPQWGLHLNGMYINDSNAGHSTNLALQSGYFTGFSANSHYGNALLNTAWNPFLGRTGKDVNGGAFGQVNAYYTQESIDGEYRAPVWGTTLTLQAQASWAQFFSHDFARISAPVTGPGGVAAPFNGATSGGVTVAGGLVQAALGGPVWQFAGRYAIVFPDPDLGVYTAGSTTVGSTYYQITDGEPISEVTFPSVVWNLNDYFTLMGEGMYKINAPEVLGDDGVYVADEQVATVSSAKNIHRNLFIPVLHVAAVFQF